MKLAQILEGGEGYVRGSSKVGDQLPFDHLSESEVDNLVKAKKIKIIDFEAADEAGALKAEVKELKAQVKTLEKEGAKWKEEHDKQAKAAIDAEAKVKTLEAENKKLTDELAKSSKGS